MQLDVIYTSLVTLVTSQALWLLILTAIPVGMALGAVPGLGGKLGLVFSIPFVAGMEPIPGAVYLLAMHSVVHTGGSIPAILLGIPGTGPDSATVCDGYPMTRRGEAGRALGASLTASAVGGVLGAVFLAALIPVVQPIVLAFGPAEFFFLALLGITVIPAVSRQSIARGLLVGALGLLLSFVGSDPQTGTERFTFGQLFLYDGVSALTASLAIFAIPEMLVLGSRPVRDTAQAARYRFADLGQGAMDVVRHLGLTIRTSFIGAAAGLMPGLGGDVASWMCYGYAVSRSPTPERFGHGAVEGVIAPDAANNSKEGGALLPTLFFGVPGSSGMAVMLGAFIMLGIQPGPAMLRDHMDLVWILIWTLVIANVLAAVCFLGLGRWLAQVASIRSGLLVPFVLLLTLIGGYVGAGDWESVVLLVGLGLAGYALKRGDWPRAPLVIGIVLGPLMEVSLHQALAIWGPGFVFRPLAALLASIIAVTIVASWRAARRTRQPAPPPAPRTAMALLLFFAAACAASVAYPAAARLAPLTVGLPACLIAAFVVSRGRHRGVPQAVSVEDLVRERRSIAWLVACTALVLVFGFVVGGTAAVLFAQRYWQRESWRAAWTSGGLAIAVTWGVFERALGQQLYHGLVAAWLQ